MVLKVTIGANNDPMHHILALLLRPFFLLVFVFDMSLSLSREDLGIIELFDGPKIGIPCISKTLNQFEELKITFRSSR